jgi:hypothetical protein
MNGPVYKKLKKQKGERFARTLRNYHNGILEIPDIEEIVRHAGRDGKALLPYLMSLLADNDNAPAPEPEDPFVLLERAGYKAFYADTLEKQNSIRGYFKEGELLCTFNDSARYQNYHIVHAVKKGTGQIKRMDFKGREKREDEYGTSVISIQMLKEGGFISIKNRYNHSVSGCDNTFNNNPDNIIKGLSGALKAHFNVEFSATGSRLPEGYALFEDQILKYHEERNNIYYGDQAWAQDGRIRAVDRGAGDALFDGFLFDNKTKKLEKIDPRSEDSFADDFNRCYGGRPGLCVDKQGNLTLNGEILIGAENSRIRTLNLPELTAMGDFCLLYNAPSLTSLYAPALKSMGDNCLGNARSLTSFYAPALTSMGDLCLFGARSLTSFYAPSIKTMGYSCLRSALSLTSFYAPVVEFMGDDCLYNAHSLTSFNAPVLKSMGDNCLGNPRSLTSFYAPAIKVMGDNCLRNARPSVKYQRLPRFATFALQTFGM